MNSIACFSSTSTDSVTQLSILPAICEMSDLKSQVLKDTNKHRVFRGNSKT